MEFRTFKKTARKTAVRVRGIELGDVIIVAKAVTVAGGETGVPLGRLDYPVGIAHKSNGEVARDKDGALRFGVDRSISGFVREVQAQDWAQHMVAATEILGESGEKAESLATEAKLAGDVLRNTDEDTLAVEKVLQIANQATSAAIKSAFATQDVPPVPTSDAPTAPAKRSHHKKPVAA